MRLKRTMMMKMGGDPSNRYYNPTPYIPNIANDRDDCIDDSFDSYDNNANANRLDSRWNNSIKHSFHIVATLFARHLRLKLVNSKTVLHTNVAKIIITDKYANDYWLLIKR